MYIVYMDDNSNYCCVPEAQFDDDNYHAIYRGSYNACQNYIKNQNTSSYDDIIREEHRRIVDDNNNDQGTDLSPWTKDDF